MSKDLKKKKVIFVINSLPGGGTEKVLVDMVNYLNPAQYDIALALFKKEGALLARIPDRVKIYDLKRSSRFSFAKMVIRLAVLLKNTDADTVMSFMFYSNLILILARILSGSQAKIIISEHEHLSSKLKHARLKHIKKFLCKMFYKYADVCVAPSEGIKNDLMILFRLDPAKIAVINNPLDLSAIDKLKGMEAEHPKDKYILAVGRLTEQKGYGYLLRAYSLICKDIDEKLVILGEGEDEDKLKRLAKDLGLEQRVLFLGFQDNPYRFMRRASVFVLSSLWESFALVIVEAMASGTAVIATDCPVGPNEIITNGVNGVLVPPADERAMARATLELLKNEDLRKRFIEAGRARAKDFSIEKIMPAYEKIL